ncbi:hypothetical protein [Glycomyces albidus]|uniref:Uncharacterized protein n=1 Tax=Glycomyces albidus TaxID=2656774 RepID=A0A6L5G6Z0_9ACTN|nr:hypothetical protein [Glycomyces albidus]MQM25402.1 hypothetical protein [Glycomyces albidus]
MPDRLLKTARNVAACVDRVPRRLAEVERHSSVAVRMPAGRPVTVLAEAISAVPVLQLPRFADRVQRKL